MTTFIADLIFGRRHGRPRSRPSPATRLLAQLRPGRRAQSEQAPDDTAASQIDTGPILTRRASAGEDGRPALRS